MYRYTHTQVCIQDLFLKINCKVIFFSVDYCSFLKFI